MRRYESAGVAVPEVLLPRAGTDLSKWAVVACDQYTSEPEYWEDADRLVGDAPSTLRLIYPEVYLNEADREGRIRRIREAMGRYLEEGVLEAHDGLVYVEREAAGRLRRGLVLAVDLDAYDYSKGSTSLIRATEGTIVERIPPRVAIRKGAPLELPHIMVLIDDPEDQVIGQVAERAGSLPLLYDFDLMKRGGHVRGRLIDDRALEEGVVRSLEALAAPAAFAARYHVEADRAVLLYAMGDGNHSLATAKAIWEATKAEAGDRSLVMDSPTRHALVELVNVHDPALVFEPIHRVLFGVAPGFDAALREAFGERLTIRPVGSPAEMTTLVGEVSSGLHRVGFVRPEGLAVLEVARPESNLAVGTLGTFLDPFVARGGAKEIDYVHGTETVVALGRKAGNVGFYLPAMSKHALFETVILDGALPRKTFSMGEAHEKRFYMECRRLLP